MSIEEILKFLENLGLNEYESKAYTALTLLGPSKAGLLSKESKVPQSKIYSVLEDLIDKQLVEVMEGRPKEFKAIAPEIALKSLLDMQEKKFFSFKDKIEEVSEYLKPAKSEEILGGIWTIKGRNWIEFFNKAAEMLRRSKKYVYGVTRDYSRSAKLAEAAGDALKRGVRIRLIGMESVNEANYLRAKWYHDNGVELRMFETTVHPRIVLVDGKEVLLRLDHNPTKREGFRFSSVWSQDASLVKVFDVYVKNLWENAKPVDFKSLNREFSTIY